MNNSWQTHHNKKIGGRPVIVQTYSGGGYRVKTTQGADHSGDAYKHGPTSTVIAPTQEGREISLDGVTISEIRDQLDEQGFTSEEIKEILGRVDKRDSQTTQFLIQDCFLESSYGSRGFVGRRMGTCRAAFAL